MHNSSSKTHGSLEKWDVVSILLTGIVHFQEAGRKGIPKKIAPSIASYGCFQK